MADLPQDLSNSMQVYASRAAWFLTCKTRNPSSFFHRSLKLGPWIPYTTLNIEINKRKRNHTNHTSYFSFLLDAAVIPMFSLILKQYSTACHKHYYVFILPSNWNPFIKIQHSVMDFFILGLTLSLKLLLVITLHKARSHTQLRQRS